MGLGCRSRPGPSPGQGSGDGGAGGRLAAAECRGRQQGERLYDWARWRLFRLHEQPWDHWLLVRRKISNPEELAYSVVFGPADTSLSTLAQVAGQRWRIEECFEAAKQEVGLADCEVRSWHGWYRHITLSMLGETQEQVLHSSRSADTSMRGASGMSHLGRSAAWKDAALISAFCLGAGLPGG